MKNFLSNWNFRTIDNMYIYIFFIYVLCLPIAKITAIQNILFLLFSLIFIYTNYTRFCYEELLKVKTFFVLFGVLFFLAILSCFNTINFQETISEIRSEFVKPLIYFLVIFFLVSLSSESKNKKLFFLLACVLLFHSILNVVIWIANGGWPSRTGGLLDGSINYFNISGGGERFGIWATYFLALSISIFFTKYKKYGYIFIVLSILSIIANHTRATFLGTIFIFFIFLVFFYKNRIIKFISLFILFLSLVLFTLYSKNFEERFNIYNMVHNIKYLNKYTPSQFKIFEDKFELGHSTVSRWAMWKSVINYRMEEPFIPQSYGRFLYSKALKDIYIYRPENIPYVTYSQAHSDFMSILFSLGILGLTFFILLLYYTLKISYKLTLNDNYKAFGIFVFLGTFGYIFSMMFGSFFGDTEQLFFYILLGVILSIYAKYINKSEIDEKTKLN